MNRNKMVAGGIVVGICCVLASQVCEAEGESSAAPIPNGSFEKAVNDRPVGWRTRTYAGEAEYEYAEGGRTGKRCVMISSKEGADAGWLGTVPVKPHSRYRLSGWIRTENVAAGTGTGALLNLHNIQPLRTPAVTGTKDWTKVELVFETGGSSAVQINCLLGGWGQSTGAAWYDDLKLDLLSTRSLKPEVQIDASKTAEPISKYIYGQFIEHLGRCIYGGIWAEMLEDRKFFYPVGDKRSPWKATNGKEFVSMSTDNVYVGKHSVAIKLAPKRGRGIEQHGLALQKGREYVARVVLAADCEPTVAYFGLSWGLDSHRSVSITDLSPRFSTKTFRFKAPENTTKARLVVGGRGEEGTLWIGAVSLMPADNIDGMRADTLGLLKELNAPMYRWPGGNFVSGYDWRDGIGPRDKRPPRKNPAWTGVEHNDFGFHEFIRFCRLLDTEPLVTVNTGFGDAYSAAAQLEYSNGSTDTLMGAARAKNGMPEPFGVRYWAIGNEMWGRWQLGYMSLNHYVQKHNWVVDKMREVDPDIIPIASGNAGSWSEGLLRNCSNHIDMIAEHFYCQERDSLIEHTSQIADNIKQKVQFHQQLREKLDSLKGKDIRIAMTEWNYWYGRHVFGELGTRYFMKDALGIAKGLHEYFRHSDMIFLANYAQTVNVIGCIKTSKTAAAFETTGLALKLYRNHFGTLPVAVTGDAYPLDVAAAWTTDRKALTIGIVNPTEREYDIPVDLKGADLAKRGRLWLIAHNDPMAYNEPGEKPKVTIEEQELSNVSDNLNAQPYSISLYELPVR